MLLGLAAIGLRWALSTGVSQGDGRQVQMPLVPYFQRDVALNELDDVEHVLSLVASLTIEYATPSWPARPVRPMRCTYVSLMLGISKLMTWLTP